MSSHPRPAPRWRASRSRPRWRTAPTSRCCPSCVRAATCSARSTRPGRPRRRPTASCSRAGRRRRRGAARSSWAASASWPRTGGCSTAPRSWTGTASSPSTARCTCGTRSASGSPPASRRRRSSQTRHGSIGLAVCYDLEFPELTRGLALQGAQLIALPTNWPRDDAPPDGRPVLHSLAAMTAYLEQGVRGGMRSLRHRAGPGVRGRQRDRGTRRRVPRRTGGRPRARARSTPIASWARPPTNARASTTTPSPTAGRRTTHRRCSTSDRRGSVAPASLSTGTGG